jgi:hypothetical protein
MRQRRIRRARRRRPAPRHLARRDGRFTDSMQQLASLYDPTGLIAFTRAMDTRRR